MGAATVETVRAAADERAREDQRAEFERIACAHREGLKAWALRDCPAGHEAEDLVQETLIRAWRSFEGYNRAVPVWHWLKAILTNLRTDYARQSARRPRRVELTEFNSPLAPFGASDERLSLEAALSRIGADHRAVLELVAQGYDYAQMAFILRVKIGTVKTRLKRARAALRNKLDG